MQRPDRAEDGPLTGEREAFERVGYARCEADLAERELAQLRARHEQLLREIDAVARENRTLEGELLQKLSEWRQLDEAQQRLEDVMPHFRAVSSSLSYRAVAALLRGINRVRRWLRLSPPAAH